MPEIRLGGSNGRTVNLQPSESLIAVRTVSRGPIVKRDLASTTRSAMKEFKSAVVFEGEDITLMHSDQISGAEMKSLLKEEDQIEFAGSALHDAASKTPVGYTEQIFVALQRDASSKKIKNVLRELGDNWFVSKRFSYGQNCFLIEPREKQGRDIFDHALKLLDMSEVDRCHPEFLRERAFKSSFPGQWHLGKRIINGQLVNQSAEVEAAWAVATGEGATIAVIDDGVDTRHPEFSQPGKIVAEFDFTAKIADARPKFSNDDHGTACAGVACASGSFGASGVAPHSRLMPLRLRSALGSMAESDALMWAVNNGADVLSCSWGPPDGKWWDDNDPAHDRFWDISDNSALAIEAALDIGRQGKGCVVCWAAGNGNESVDLDGYASKEGVMAVAACSDTGDRSVYSDMGDAIACTFPSNNFQHGTGPTPLTPGISTTDRSGNSGYNKVPSPEGDYTDDFGGTSSACPGAAGVAALLVSANPQLTGKEIQQTMLDTADKIDTAGGVYNAKGHSPKYGYGRLNAENAAYSVFNNS